MSQKKPPALTFLKVLEIHGKEIRLFLFEDCKMDFKSLLPLKVKESSNLGQKTSFLGFLVISSKYL